MRVGVTGVTPFEETSNEDLQLTAGRIRGREPEVYATPLSLSTFYVRSIFAFLLATMPFFVKDLTFAMVLVTRRFSSPEDLKYLIDAQSISLRAC
jgi:hypothetical protein